jgi:hypothetical protein
VARDEPHVSVGGLLELGIFGRTMQQMRQIGPRRRVCHILRKSSVCDRICGNPDADVDKPSHVRVRVLECIVRVLTHFCSINRRGLR